MKVYGASQSSGVERELRVERGGHGVVLTIVDHAGNKVRGRILVETDDLLSAITDPPAEGAMVPGLSPPYGPAIQLHIEVRRNEVQFRVLAGPGKGADVAVGLDDFQDALESAIGAM